MQCGFFYIPSGAPTQNYRVRWKRGRFKPRIATCQTTRKQCREAIYINVEKQYLASLQGFMVMYEYLKNM